MLDFSAREYSDNIILILFGEKIVNNYFSKDAFIFLINILP